MAMNLVRLFGTYFDIGTQLLARCIGRRAYFMTNEYIEEKKNVNK